MIAVDDYLWFVDQALDGMIGIVTELGDDLANTRLDFAGGNSPYAVLTHCLGVMEEWAGQLVAGRTIERDRDAEFRAEGAVDELVARAHHARQQLALDVSRLDAPAAPRGPVDPGDAVLPLGRTQAGALLHLYEELAQHRGQMETCRDVLLAPWARTT